MSGPRWRSALAAWLRADGPVLLAYVAATLVMTYPLVTHFGTHIPGSNGDAFQFPWNIWWFQHAIFDLGQDPFTTNYIFYPLGVSLTFYTLSVLNDILALPLVPVLGIVVANNVLVVASLAASGYGAFCLARHVLAKAGVRLPVRTASALIAGLAFAFPASRFVYVNLGHYNVISAQWLPFYLLFFLVMLEGLAARQDGDLSARPLRAAAAAGITLFLALLSEMFFGVFLLLLSALAVCFAPRRVVLSKGMAACGAVLALTAAVLYAPVGYFIVRDVLAGQGLNFPGWGYADLLSADLVGLFTPTALQTFLGAGGHEARARFTDVNTAFMGYAVPLLALAAAIVYRRRLAMWITGALASVVLSLGPILHINGATLFDLDGLAVTVPLPYLAFHYLPLLSMTRAPNRFSLTFSLCFAVLAAFAAAGLLERMRGKGWRLALAGTLAVVVLADGLSIPLPLSDASVPGVYARIAEEPGDFTILTLPLGWRESFGTLGAEQTNIQYYQTVHGKRLINGNTSRVTAFKFDYFARIGLVKSIVDEEMYRPVDEARRQREREAALEALYFFDVRYVVLNPAIPGRLPYSDTITRTEGYVLSVLPLEPAFSDGNVRAYRVVQPPARPSVAVDLGTPSARLYQGEGWGDDEGGSGGATFCWAMKQGSRLFIPLRLEGDYRLRLVMMPFAYPGGPQQTVKISVNGRALPQTLALAPAWAPYELDVPARYVRAGINEVTLDFGYVASPRDVLPADFAIGTTGARSPVELTVQSAAAYSSVRVGDADTATGEGITAVVVDQTSGRVLETRSLGAGAAAWVAGLPAGRVVAVTGRGLPPDLALEIAGALGKLGVEPGKLGVAFAAVGVVGSAPGQAVQQGQPAGATAYLHIGPNADRRTLAVAVDSVMMTKVSP
jgi:hypothetical protein